jgi:hypothetical protein
MSRLNKLIQSVWNNPRDVRFEDACKVARALGFVEREGDGSHRVFGRPGEPVGLNFQNRKGKIWPYQAHQLIDMIEKYWVQS